MPYRIRYPKTTENKQSHDREVYIPVTEMPYKTRDRGHSDHQEAEENQEDFSCNKTVQQHAWERADHGHQPEGEASLDPHVPFTAMGKCT